MPIEFKVTRQSKKAFKDIHQQVDEFRSINKKLQLRGMKKGAAEVAGRIKELRTQRKEVGTLKATYVPARPIVVPDAYQSSVKNEIRNIMTFSPECEDEEYSGTQAASHASGRMVRFKTRTQAALSRIVLADKLEVSGLSKFQLMKKLRKEIQTEVSKLRAYNRPKLEEYSFAGGLKVQRLGGVFLEKGNILKAVLYKVRADMTRAKKPTTTDNYLGIEIEFACKQNIEEVADAIFEAGIGKHFHVHSDGSINADDQFPNKIELNVLVKQTEYVDVLTRLCGVLNTKLQCRVDKSCGIHVHVDMRHRDHIKAFNNLVLSQQLLYGMNPVARRNGQYSVPIPGKGEWRASSNHYDGISTSAYTKYKTLELRMHCGTTQAKKLVNWIAFIVAIVDAPKLAAQSKSVSELRTNGVYLTEEVVTYVNSRIAKFSNQHKTKQKALPEMPDLLPVESAPADDTATEMSEVA